MKNTIWFDLDGTLANLYNVPNWLSRLINSDPTPYKLAAPLVNMKALARQLHKLQRKGYKIGIISWLSKNSTIEYDEMVYNAKISWLNFHLPSIKWNEIKIVPYGTNKWNECQEGILFDDEAQNRDSWQDEAYEPTKIFEILTQLIKTV